uniref:Uncharacterized protein n=1 Tax=Seriola lalandi dorsalis TaxID=1841481 RepID=A0A3B4WQX4_SERLL
MGQHTLLHGEALLVVASADAHHITLQKVSSNLSGHTLLIESTFWQPVAGNEMFSCKSRKVVVGRERISAPWSHIGLMCYRDNLLHVVF